MKNKTRERKGMPKRFRPTGNGQSSVKTRDCWADYKDKEQYDLVNNKEVDV